MKTPFMKKLVGATSLFALAAGCSSMAPTEPGGEGVEVTGEAAQAVAFLVTCPPGVPVPPAPDLVVDKTVVLHGGTCPGTDPFITPLGTQVDYCLTVANNSAQDVHDINAVDDNGTGKYTFLNQLLIDAGLADSNNDGQPDTLSAGQSVAIQYGPFTFADPDGELVTRDTVRVGFTFSVSSTKECLAYYTDPSTVVDGPACVQQPALCDDGSACTVDACDPASGCTHLAVSCDDGSACTVDACDPASGCTHLALSCDDASACTVDACDPASGCTHEALSCSDADACTADTCDPASGCVYTPVWCPTGTGATRTIGYYANHPSIVTTCLDALGGTLDLGFVTLRNETVDDEIDVDVDSRVETGLMLTLGVLKANVAKYTTGAHRSALAKARMKAGQQMVAAICNNVLTGASPSFDLAAAVATLEGDDVAAILAVNGQADAFNNSNDNVALGLDGGPAAPKAAWDDPTDAND